MQMMLAPAAPPPPQRPYERWDEIEKRKGISVGGRGRVQMMLAPTAPLPQRRIEKKKDGRLAGCK